MFGRDTLILSKPQEIKTVAKNFSESMKKVTVLTPSRNVVSEPVKTASRPITSTNRVPVSSAQTVDNSNLNEIEITMKKGYLKLETVKPFARNFLKQVNKLDEVKDLNEKDVEGKIIFSYSDSKGRWGKLEDNGEKIKVVCIKKHQSEYDEEQIDIYSLNEYDIQPSGIFIQVKGWGNLKELSLVNALKNSIHKFSPNRNSGENEKIIYKYSLSSMSALLDGGWECKVKVIAGIISE